MARWSRSAAAANRESYIIAKGERTIQFRLTSEAQMTLGDGRTCTLSSVFVVANDKVVRSEQVGPICG